VGEVLHRLRRPSTTRPDEASDALLRMSGFKEWVKFESKILVDERNHAPAMPIQGAGP
jgi:hypothetical protein